MRTEALEVLKSKLEDAENRVFELSSREEDSFEFGELERKARIYEARGAVGLIEDAISEIQGDNQ